MAIMKESERWGRVAIVDSFQSLSGTTLTLHHLNHPLQTCHTHWLPKSRCSRLETGHPFWWILQVLALLQQRNHLPFQCTALFDGHSSICACLAKLAQAFGQWLHHCVHGLLLSQNGPSHCTCTESRSYDWTYGCDPILLKGGQSMVLDSIWSGVGGGGGVSKVNSLNSQYVNIIIWQYYWQLTTDNII